MTILWLDDRRDPTDDPVALSRLPLEEGCKVVWVKNYNQFVNHIYINGLPDYISFDHDIEEDQYAPKEYWDGRYLEWKEEQNIQSMTGEDCAKFLVNYCISNDFLDLPAWNVHSMNPVGSKLITDAILYYHTVKAIDQADDENFSIYQKDTFKLN